MNTKRFTEGSRVIVISRNNAHGIVSNIINQGNKTFYYVKLDNGGNATLTEEHLREELINPDAFDLMAQANFQPRIVFFVASVINKMYGNNNDIIATLKSSKTSFLPYQFKPLIKFLNSDNRRILIADEVGLGKTIEAGYILAELSLRGQIKNCLVICKSSLKEKWQIELKEKFGFHFKIYDRKGLRKAIEEDVEMGMQTVFGIINYDYSKKGSDDLLESIKSHEYNFDMLIVDEAHVLRNIATIKHQAVKQLIEISANTILLTATPLMTSIVNLYSLVKIIEPKYDDYQYSGQDFGFSLFMDHLALSKPFIKAINSLNNGQNPKKIINTLSNDKITTKIYLLDGSFSYPKTMTVEEKFSTDPLFISTQELARRENLTNAELALLQKKLSDLNSFQNIITRTRKREIQTDVQKVTRHAQKCSVKFDENEMDLYNSIIEDYEGDPFALVTKKREATSCLPAYLEKHNLFHPDLEEIIAKDSKFQKLNEIIEKVVVQDNKKLIVFSFFKGTLKYLEKKLNPIGITTIKIDGSVDIDKRQSQIDKFQKDKNIKVLLSSEIGSEGLDMQFCDAIVNYDLPWNPMVVEQRIGRIDRIGQQSEIIHIYNLCIANTIEDQIFERLLTRIHVFTESIGSLEDILTSDENVFEQEIGLEQEIYGKQLTKAAIEQKINQIELAIANAELQRKNIEEDLDDSFINDQYIKDEISAINKQKRFIGPEDVKSLLTYLFQTRLATLRCDLESINPYIRWDDGNKTIFDFINENIPDKRDNPQLFNKYLDFKRKFATQTKVECTFYQHEAYENRKLEFISPVHPLAQAAFNYLNNQAFATNNAFFFCIDSSEVKSVNLKDSAFVLAKFSVEALRHTMGKPTPERSVSELQMLFSLSENGEFVLMDEDVTNSILGVDAKYWYTNPNLIPKPDECAELVEKLKPILLSNIFVKKIDLEKEQGETHTSKQYRLIDAEIDFLSRQIEKDEEVLDQLLRADPGNTIKFIYNKRIKEYKEKIIELKKQRSKIKFELHETLQSLSIIIVQ